jgi:flagellar biosynthesis/type III secretory pathway protein FliH
MTLKTFIFENLDSLTQQHRGDFFAMGKSDPLLIFVEPYFPNPIYNQQDIDHHYQDGYEHGLDDGKKALKTTIENAIANALEQLVVQLPNFEQQLEQDKQEAQQLLFSVMRLIITRVFQAHIAEQAILEVETALKSCIEIAYQSPHIRIYVNSTIVTQVENYLKQSLSMVSSTQSLHILADENLPLGDCRIEWQGGTLRFDQAELWSQIDHILGIDSLIPPSPSAPNPNQQPTTAQ